MATAETYKTATATGSDLSARAVAAAKDAGFAGIVTLGLCFPIIALRAE